MKDIRAQVLALLQKAPKLINKGGRIRHESQTGTNVFFYPRTDSKFPDTSPITDTFIKFVQGNMIGVIDTALGRSLADAVDNQKNSHVRLMWYPASKEIGQEQPKHMMHQDWAWNLFITIIFGFPYDDGKGLKGRLALQVVLKLGILSTSQITSWDYYNTLNENQRVQWIHACAKVENLAKLALAKHFESTFHMQLIRYEHSHTHSAPPSSSSSASSSSSKKKKIFFFLFFRLLVPSSPLFLFQRQRKTVFIF